MRRSTWPRCERPTRRRAEGYVAPVRNSRRGQGAQRHATTDRPHLRPSRLRTRHGVSSAVAGRWTGVLERVLRRRTHASDRDGTVGWTWRCTWQPSARDDAAAHGHDPRGDPHCGGVALGNTSQRSARRLRFLRAPARRRPRAGRRTGHGVVDARCHARLFVAHTPETAAVSRATVIAMPSPERHDTGKHVRQMAVAGRQAAE